MNGSGVHFVKMRVNRVNIRHDQKEIRMKRLSQKRGRQILIDDRFNATHLACFITDHRNTATAGGNHCEACPHQ